VAAPSVSHGDGHCFFGFILADDVSVEVVYYLAGCHVSCDAQIFFFLLSFSGVVSVVSAGCCCFR
jgi:hypothetical protein